MTWTEADSVAACREGWDIFYLDADETRPEIEFLQDEPENRLTNDDQAIAIVEYMAAYGSPLHTKALKLERSHDHGQGRNYWYRAAPKTTSV
jgi:hypothetical protein